MKDHEIFIMGANGQLGTALRQLYPEARSADRDTLDMTDWNAVNTYDWTQTKLILNAAGYTAVDLAETAEGRRDAWQVNAVAVANLARIAISHDITLVHVSTEYVFDGTVSPHLEDEPFTPLSVYGQTKAAGDLAASLATRHYIARISWLIGDGKNFVRTMADLAERGIAPSVVDDQIGRLTFTDTLSRAIKHLIDSEAPYGTYNISNDGDPASWADIAKLVYEARGHSADEVTPVSTEEYYAGKDGIAPRPLQSTLDLAKLKSTGFEPEDWREKLKEYLEVSDV